jgi:hypothetical protein
MEPNVNTYYGSGVFSLGTDILGKKWPKEVAKNPQNVFFPKSGPDVTFGAMW